VRSDRILQVLPKRIQQLKVDVERADLNVLLGAGYFLTMLDTVIIECLAPYITYSTRVGECQSNAAIA
jgi:hypothetical protein